MADVKGWSLLLEGKLPHAAFEMYNFVLNGWVLAILFFAFQAIIIIKTRNVTLAFVTAIIFTTVYGFSSYMKPIVLYILFVLMAFELGIIFYKWVSKK